MRIKIATVVPRACADVMASFNQTLFAQLNPPFPPVRILRFDGSKTGDEVHLRMNFILFKQDWVSLITESKTSEEGYYFIDEGIKLPFFLSYWKHKHIINCKGIEMSEIIDDVSFSGSRLIPSLLIYPVLWLLFWYRKPVYKKVFG